MLRFIFILQVSINFFKMLGYGYLGFWILILINAIDLSQVKEENLKLLQIIDNIDGQILYVTAIVAFLEVINHFLNFGSMINNYTKEREKLEDFKDKKRQRELEYYFKNHNDLKP